MTSLVSSSFSFSFSYKTAFLQCDIHVRDAGVWEDMDFLDMFLIAYGWLSSLIL